MVLLWALPFVHCAPVDRNVSDSSLSFLTCERIPVQGLTGRIEGGGLGKGLVLGLVVGKCSGESLGMNMLREGQVWSRCGAGVTTSYSRDYQGKQKGTPKLPSNAWQGRCGPERWTLPGQTEHDESLHSPGWVSSELSRPRIFLRRKWR